MPPKLTRDCLSEYDRQVLDSIFNPLQITSTFDHQEINPTTEVDLVDIEDDADAANVKTSKALEIAAVKLAEDEKNLDEALKLFGETIRIAPERASVYNNRAQALRLAGRDDEALQDLNKSIELADKQLRTKCHAHCQRGALYRKRENIDAARKDFEEGAKMGSKFAKAQLIELNPYAALCNQMLRQAFEQLK